MLKKLILKYKNLPQQVKASVWFVICGFIQKAISLLTTPIFSRILSTSEYGIFSVFMAWQNIVIIIASLNLASGVYLRGLIKFEDDSDEFTASLQSLYVINWTFVFGIYGIFYGFWNSVTELPTTYMCAMFLDILVSVSFNFWSARQRVEYKYRALVAVTIINAIVKPTVGIIAVLNSNNRISARIYTIVLVDILVFGCFFCGMFVKKGKRISKKYWKYALAYNLPLVPHYLSQIVLNQSDRVMINSICGSDEAGIYSLAYNAAIILTIINQSILNSYNPWMYKSIRDKEYSNIEKVSVSLLSVVGVLNLALIAFAPEVIYILAPPSYYKAIWVIPPVAMSVFFMFMYSLFSNFEFYYEKTKLMMMASVGGAILNILLNQIFIKKVGFLAAGYTTLVCYLCYCIFHYIVMKRILKAELKGLNIYNMKNIICISLVFVLSGAVLMCLYNYILIRYIIIMLITLGVFVKRKRIINFVRDLLQIANDKK